MSRSASRYSGSVQQHPPAAGGAARRERRARPGARAPPCRSGPCPAVPDSASSRSRASAARWRPPARPPARRRRTAIRTGAPGACWRAFDKRLLRHPVERGVGDRRQAAAARPRADQSTVSPSVRAVRDQPVERAEPGRGRRAVLAVAGRSRSTPTIRRRLSRVSLPCARIQAVPALAASGSLSICRSTAAAWTTMPDRWCAATSCSSRAMRVRSAKIAASARSRWARTASAARLGRQGGVPAAGRHVHRRRRPPTTYSSAPRPEWFSHRSPAAAGAPGRRRAGRGARPAPPRPSAARVNRAVSEGADGVGGDGRAEAAGPTDRGRPG